MSTASVPGPVGPQGPQGDPAQIAVTCEIQGRTITCKVTPVGAAVRTARLTATVRLAGRRERVTRSGRGAMRVRLKARRRIARSQRIRVVVRSGDEVTRLTLRASKLVKGR